MTDSRPFLCPELLLLRGQNARRRAAAMALPDNSVLGLPIRPLSPASYSRLFAIGSPFLFPEADDISRADVHNYIWFHAENFTTDLRHQHRAKARTLAALERHIAPPWRRWRYSRAAWLDLRAMGYANAIAQIRDIVRDTFADEPPPGVDGGSSSGAALEAQLIHLFALRYGWSADTTRHTPLCQLYQLLRCISPVDYDREEARLIADRLRQANEHPATAA